MGGKLEDLEFKKLNFVPGPGTHDVELRKSIPSMKFGSGQRTNLAKQTLSPGPGGYQPEPTNVQKAAPKFGFGSSTRATGGNLKLKVPGPGNYASKTYTGKDSASYSMGAV